MLRNYTKKIKLINKDPNKIKNNNNIYYSKNIIYKN